MIYQLQSPIYVTVTSKDNAFGRCLGWIDHGPDVSLLWIVALENREVWIAKNEEIRVAENWSLDYEHPKADDKTEPEPTITLHYDDSRPVCDWGRIIREETDSPSAVTTDRDVDIPGSITTPVQPR